MGINLRFNSVDVLLYREGELLAEFGIKNIHVVLSMYELVMEIKVLYVKLTTDLSTYVREN